MFCPSGHCLCRTLQSESTRIWNDLQDAETVVGQFEISCLR